MKKFNSIFNGKLQYLVLGVLVGSLMAPVSSFAGTMMKNISVDVNSVSIFANGKEVNADNFIYQGTTYVPLRACAEALGEEVNYLDATHEVILGEDTRVEQAKIQENIDNNKYPVTDDVTFYDWGDGSVPDAGSFFGMEEENFFITYDGTYSYKYNYQLDKKYLYLYSDYMKTLGYEIFISSNMDYYEGTALIICKKDNIEISIGLSYGSLLIIDLAVED